MNEFSPSQVNVMNQDCRQMLAAGFSLGDILNDLYGRISTGTVGVQAKSWDLDSLALGGGAFSVDPDLTTGLVFAWRIGRLMKGLSVLTVAAGTLTLPPSTTSYVEVDPATGTVSSNTVSFTAGRVPLYVITTGVSAIATTTNAKALLAAFGLGSISGQQLTLAGSTKSIEIPLGSIAATTSFPVLLPAVPGTIVKASFVTATAVGADDTNFWTFDLQNKGPAGTGSTPLLAATDANTTKATGGSAMSTYVKRDLTLHGTPANLLTLAGDVLVFTATKTAAATTMANGVLRIDQQFSA